MFTKAIDFLLENACVSIRYNIHRDFLKTPITDTEMQLMQSEILNQINVINLIATKNEDGWLGDGLHGGSAIE